MSELTQEQMETLHEMFESKEVLVKPEQERIYVWHGGPHFHVYNSELEECQYQSLTDSEGYPVHPARARKMLREMTERYDSIKGASLNDYGDTGEDSLEEL